jgi:hypothetical protein
MNLQNKVRTILILLVLLFLMNIALVAYIYRQSHPEQSKDEPKREARLTNEDSIVDYLKKEINFSNEQLQAYLNDKEMHMQKMRQIRMEIRFRQRDYIALLIKDSISENEKQEHLKELTSEYGQLELEVFRHFNQIKSIATDQQRQKMSVRFHQVLGDVLFPLRR